MKIMFLITKLHMTYFEFTKSTEYVPTGVETVVAEM